MVKFFYTKLFKEKKKTRGFAILLAYLVAILLLVLLAWLVIPQIVDSIAMLFTNFPSYIHSVQDMLGMVQERFGVDLSSATKVLDDSEAMVKEIYNMASAAMPQIVASIGSVASNFVAIFTSIAASIYMLADKDHLLRPAAHAGARLPAGEGGLQHAAHLPLRQCKLYGLFCGQDHRLRHHRCYHLCSHDDPAA